ncbi:hypothetical protein TKK_0005067 [Trichogramma kaykai]
MASANEIMQNVANLKAIRNIANLGQEEVEQLLERCNSTIAGIAQFFPGRRNMIRRASLLIEVQALQKKLQNRLLNNIQHADMDTSDDDDDDEPLDERVGGEIADNGEKKEEEVDEAAAEISNGEEEEEENNEAIGENSNGEEENTEGTANLVRNRVSNDNLVWRDTERMFRSAVRMGEIVNNTHVDVGVFGASFIPLPKQISNKGATVNVINKDEKCFMWSILAALHPDHTNRNRVQHYLSHVNELNFGDLKFPIKVCDIDKFEKLNPTIAINLHKLRIKNGEYIVNPCRCSKKDYMHDKNIKLINLLYLQNYYKDEGMDDVETAKLNYLEDPPVAQAEEIKAHYVLITSMDALLNSQINAQH